jgi:3-phenylpropionate/trans-cinnamate dioxygenase ferredoxin reductase component
MTQRRIVVVGASLAGLRSAESVRAAGWTDELVVVGEEAHLPYNRPPLSKQALAGGVEHGELAFRRRKSVDDVVWRLGHPAVASSLADRTVTLAGGEVLDWHGLVIATGLRVRRLPEQVAGGVPATGAGRHAVRTLEDAAALGAELGPGVQVVVLGAGFIGCEVAATAIGLGCSVTVVAPEEVPMQRPLGLQVGAALQRRHEQRGVVFRLGHLPATLLAADPEGVPPADRARVRGVRLDDGSELPADVVVEALGCLPNVEWLAGNGLDLTDGVATDDALRVCVDGGSRADVVAAGDIARFPNALYGPVARRVEHWNIPTETGRRAGPSLVAGLNGDPAPAGPFVPMPAFWSDQYGLRLQSFGALAGADEIRVLEGDLDGEFAAGYFAHGRLTGVAGIGLMPTLMRLRGELQEQLTPAP